jgi:hypothetical protein
MNAETGGAGLGVAAVGPAVTEGSGEGAVIVAAAFGTAPVGDEWQTESSIVAAAIAAERRVSTAVR